MGISNKKDGQMNDPQNNTTPKKRFEQLAKKYGKDVVLYWLTSGNYGSLDEQSNNPDFDKKVASFAKKINNEIKSK